MAATTVTVKGQVTIPKAIRDALGVKPGDRVVFVQQVDGRVVVEAETVDVRSLRGMLRHRGRPVTVEEMNAAIARGASS
jgi:antitoxin PrlF